MTMHRRIALACLVGLALMVGPVFGQGDPVDNNNVPDTSSADSRSLTALYWAEGLWLVLIGIGGPLYSRFSGRKNGEKDLRGLNLPNGSIRSMLALLVIGSFLIVLVFGAPVFGESLDSIIGSFGALTGSVLGFYFGTRSATPAPEEKRNPPDSDVVAVATSEAASVSEVQSSSHTNITS